MAALYNEQQLRELVKKAVRSEAIPIVTRRNIENRLIQELGNFIHSAIVNQPPSAGYYDD